MMDNTAPLITRERAILAACLALAVIIPAWLLTPGDTTVDPPPPPTITRLKIASSEAATDAVVAPLFNVDRKAPPSTDAAGQGKDGQKNAEAAMPTLVGIMTGPHGKSLALIRSAEGQTTVAHVGDTIDEWQISAVSMTGVALSKSGEEHQLSLDYGNKQQPGQGSAPMASQAGEMK